MSARGFVETSERYGNIYRSVAQTVCRTCGITASIGIKTPAGLLPPNEIQKKFEQKGWVIGANPKWDVCPDCVRKVKKTMLKVVEAAAETVAAEPRVMSREDRRVVFEKLNEVYIDEKRGYDSGWSDQKVATDLGVPRKWVETIRDENFGPLGTNEDAVVYVKEAEAFLADAKEALKEARAAREACEKILKSPALLTVANIAERLGKIERLANELRKTMGAA